METGTPGPASRGEGPTAERFGLLAEFEDPAGLVRAAEGVRQAGYTRWDCYSPFPVHGLNQAMGLRDTKLPWVVMGAGVTGLGVAILMQWWMNAVDYPLVIGGKPFFSLPANIPVAFELTVLFSAVTAFLAMFAFNGLPRFYHPVFRSPSFKQATNDRFFLCIESTDPIFDLRRTDELLRSLGCRSVERLEA